jgi:hypothetical protein
MAAPISGASAWIPFVCSRFRFLELLKSLAEKPENPGILLLLREVALSNAAAEAAFAIYTEAHAVR